MRARSAALVAALLVAPLTVAEHEPGEDVWEGVDCVPANVAELTGLTDDGCGELAGAPAFTFSGPASVPAGEARTYAGTYRFDASRGIPGAVVELWEDRARVASTTTAADGSFAFARTIAFGRHELSARAHGPTFLYASRTLAVYGIAAPDAPVGLSVAQGPRMRDLTLDWPAQPHDPTRPIAGLVVSRLDPGGWTDLATLPPTARSFLVREVPYDVLLKYALSAQNAAGRSPRAEVVGVAVEHPIDTLTQGPLRFHVCWSGAGSGCTDWSAPVPEGGTFAYDAAQAPFFIAFEWDGAASGAGFPKPRPRVDVAWTIRFDGAAVDGSPSPERASLRRDDGRWSHSVVQSAGTDVTPGPGCHAWEVAVMATADAASASRVGGFTMCPR